MDPPNDSNSPTKGFFWRSVVSYTWSGFHGIGGLEIRSRWDGRRTRYVECWKNPA